jgi:hypothetical protein
MPCYRPIRAYRSKFKNKNGKYGLVFKVTDIRANPLRPVEVACGKCVGCDLDKAGSWALRCMHELKYHEEACFITLTYDKEHLPYGYNLVKKDLQLFWKRLRKEVKKKIMYMACGEYGTEGSRPHYHAIVFGWRPKDLKIDETYKGKADVHYTSDTLDRIWKNGRTGVGEVTYESAGYVARYQLKKRERKAREGLDKDTGEIIERIPEFITMSTNPAIGKRWIEKYLQDTYKDDFIVQDGRKMNPPKYYDKVLEKHQPEKHEEVKKEREKKTMRKTAYRLQAAEKIKLAQIFNVKRGD